MRDVDAMNPAGRNSVAVIKSKCQRGRDHVKRLSDAQK